MPELSCCPGMIFEDKITGSFWITDLSHDCIRVSVGMNWNGSRWDNFKGDTTYLRVTLDCDGGMFSFDNGTCGVFGSGTLACGAFMCGMGCSTVDPAACCNEPGHQTDCALYVVNTPLNMTSMPPDILFPPPPCRCKPKSCPVTPPLGGSDGGTGGCGPKGCAKGGYGAGGGAQPALSPFSKAPVRYASGEVSVVATDLQSEGFAIPWGHTRSFASRLSISESEGNGYNWQVQEWPYLVVHGDLVYASVGPNTALWFDKISSTFVARFGLKQSLVLDVASSRYRLTDIDGTITEFDSLSGMFRQRTDTAGNTIEVTSLHSNNFNIGEVQRSYSAGGHSAIEKYGYSYELATGGTTLSSVTLSRSIDAGSFQNVLRAEYTYYGSEVPHGGDGDLQTVTTQVWQDGDWATTGTTYYRYYPEFGSSSSSSSSSSSGGDAGGWDVRAHLLKYVVNPAAYDRLVADGHDPLTVSDATLLQYADFYFEYDNQRRVTKETIMSGSQTFQFAYEASGFSDDYNHWARKTTETLPDGNQNIVYLNYAGQTMLKVFQSGADQWIEFARYDDSGNVIMCAHPSAVSGYDDSYADLLNYDSGSGTYEYLRDNAGLIETSSYHAPSGFLASESLQEGQLGSPIPQRAWEYCQCGSDCGCGSSSSSSSSSSSGGDGGIWFISREILYPDDTNSERTIVTNHCYSFHDGTCAVQQHTTTLPVVPVDQNGSGIANINRECFDTCGKLTWRMDERGFTTRMSYHIPTGALAQLVTDVDTGMYEDVPAGWITPSGGGLNLITDFENDDQGRITQTLGPKHTIDLNGEAIEIRCASWTVYDDANHIKYLGQGFAAGSAPDYEYTLVNPVSITKMDARGEVNEQIQAAAPAVSGTLAEIIETAGGGENAFPRTTYTRWTTFQHVDCCLAASRRVYHTIPDSGEGDPGTNYDETDYGYDIMKRRRRTVSPGGTITDLVFESRGLVVATYVGTNDDGATETDPTSGGLDPDNNMVIVTANEYDDGGVGGDGNLTEVTQYVDGTTTRVTSKSYDFRGRNVSTDGEVDYFQKLHYDNRNRVVKTERYDTTAMGNLIAFNETKYDDLARVFQTIRYAVDPNTGEMGSCLTDNTWFNASGNPIKSLPAGSNQFTKTIVDSLGRAIKIYHGYDLDETDYDEIFTVDDDVIMEQIETTYDSANNALQATTRLRYHNAPDSQKGALQDPVSTPKARVTYVTTYPDTINRAIATVNYGTNGGTSLSRPSTIPSRSDTVLVNNMSYDDAGNMASQTNSAGIITSLGYDNAGRQTRMTLNCKTTSSSSSSSSSSSGSDCTPSNDVNVTVLTSYNADGNVSAVTAVNLSTGNQTTQYVYGTTLADSDIASTLLKVAEIYPDSEGGDDQVSIAYNRQGQVKRTTDQNGTIHQTEFDKLGRQTHDRVIAVGTGIDDAVLRLSTEYEVRGMKSRLTSWNNASVSSGDAVNECLFEYNEFGQLVTEYQEHYGEVNTSTTPNIQYGFADGISNTIRPMSLTYPNGRVLDYSYSTASSIPDAISRVDAIKDGGTVLTRYSYLGGSVTAPSLRIGTSQKSSARFVVSDYTEPEIKWTMVDLSGSNDPDTGDIYSGFDRFGRIKDSRWYNYGDSEDVDRIKYGYDRNGNRTYRQNSVASNYSEHFDELYLHDLIDRLKHMDRGNLTALHDVITDKTFAQCWTLDETGNWNGFRQDDDGNGTWDLKQTRASNSVNEVTEISALAGTTWATPEYDAAGNMTSMPSLANPTVAQTCEYDAWNRLVRVTEGSDTVSSHVYDAAARRVIQISYDSGDLTETRHLYYTEPSDWRVIEERLGTTPYSADAERQQVWGLRYVDDLLVRDRDDDNDGILDERIYVAQDANWNVVAIAGVDAAVLERYAYSAYGTPTYLTQTFTHRQQSAFGWNILYGGYRLTSNGLYSIRHRVFHSELGAWLQRDPKRYRDCHNLYLYCMSNPTVMLDPYGLTACAFLMDDCLGNALGCLCAAIGLTDLITGFITNMGPVGKAVAVIINGLDCLCEIARMLTIECACNSNMDWVTEIHLILGATGTWGSCFNDIMQVALGLGGINSGQITAIIDFFLELSEFFIDFLMGTGSGVPPGLMQCVAAVRFCPKKFRSMQGVAVSTM